jgi:hypothetical protein
LPKLLPNATRVTDRFCKAQPCDFTKSGLSRWPAIDQENEAIEKAKLSNKRFERHNQRDDTVGSAHWREVVISHKKQIKVV